MIFVLEFSLPRKKKQTWSELIYFVSCLNVCQILRFWSYFVSLQKYKTEQTLKWIQVCASSNTHKIDLPWCAITYILEKKFSWSENLMHVKKCSFKVSNIFIDFQVLICNFHREQAWERWLNATKYSAKNDDYGYSTL